MNVIRSTWISIYKYSIINFVIEALNTLFDETKYNEVAKKSKFYKNNIRIKPFLTAFARINCAKLALSKINNVVRICVDSVVFDEPLSHTLLNKFKNLKPEDKTTGQIYFEHVNNYEKIGENPKINKTVHHYEEDEELLLLEKELMDKF